MEQSHHCPNDGEAISNCKGKKDWYQIQQKKQSTNPVQKSKAESHFYWPVRSVGQTCNSFYQAPLVICLIFTIIYNQF